jgi:hypothetical protein
MAKKVLHQASAYLCWAASVTAFILGSTACYAQTGYVPGRPSIDCSNVYNTVALILCNSTDAAEADWQVNSASWALYFSIDEAQRPKLDLDQQAWRQSLDRVCALPRQPTQQEQAQQLMAQTMGRVILGPRLVIPGPQSQPITQAHVNCVLNAYRTRVAMLRSRLTGDALAEARLSPEAHVQIQQALFEKGFLSSDQVGFATHDGEFGPVTRKAIRQFQQGLGASPTGFLSIEQWTMLLETPGERAAGAAMMAAEARATQAAIEAQVAEAKARQEAEIAEAKAKQEAEIARLQAEAEAARQWQLKVDEAQAKGKQYADKAEWKWSLSEVANPMTDDNDYTVSSVQRNRKGAVAEIEGTCQKPGEVTFVATLNEEDTDDPLGLPDFANGYIAGTKRLNDDPPFPTRFQNQKNYRNQIFLARLTSSHSAESIDTTWRVLAEIETARGRIFIQIPMFNSNVQKLLTACAKQYEKAAKRGGLPDAPRTFR